MVVWWLQADFAADNCQVGMTSTTALTGARHAAPRPDFDETSRQIPITAEERLIGIKTKAYFDRTLKRTTPWLIKNAQIRILLPTAAPRPREADPLRSE